MDYQFGDIEKKWRKKWEESGLYEVKEDPAKPKYYVLDMFPYPSGAGLHVGHPLGYVASDIVARYKRLNGFNVLHPMGFDAFGLPAEQYAIETGQHPAVTTKKNIDTYREQMKMIGFSFDWSREVKTSDPGFYKWTQWIFMQLFNSWFNPEIEKAESIDTLIALLDAKGSSHLFEKGKTDENISAGEWRNKSGEEKQKFLMQFRLAYLDYADIWWCEQLGTVLANDEVKDGVSERGGYPVEKIKMRQWFLRITEYAERLLKGLDTLDWSESMKEMQRNWIGKSEGALIEFKIAGEEIPLQIFTTRPDTIFGATFMVLAPEHELVGKITTTDQKTEVDNYIRYVKSRSERDRMSEVKKVTGQFTGAYALHPFTNKKIPVYIAEYVLAGYGTGAIMAVPSNDDRDRAFAEKFNLEIIPVVDQSMYPNAGSEDKVGKMINSDFLNGLEVKDAIQKIIGEIENKKIGKRKINYRFRDAGFSRQRYWGEPFPVYYVNDIPYLVDEKELPVILPEVTSYKPTGAGKSPLAALDAWKKYKNGERETDTMPGYAGSSWYMLRYMSPNNDGRFVSKEAEDYWRNVDLYIGGTEHAVGHLLYSRLWQKFLYDRGWVHEDEPFKKLVNQGMIQGMSSYIGRIENANIYISRKIYDKLFNNRARRTMWEEVFDLISESDIPEKKKKELLNYETKELNFSLLINKIRVFNKFIDKEDFYLDIRKFRAEYNLTNSYFLKDITEDQFYCLVFIEKMSKRYGNVVNPDDVISDYGADVFRLYEMFLGPIDAAKPWDTKGITGVSGFIRKVWRLFYDENKNWKVTDEAASPEELKILHKTIKKAGEDIEKLSFNTAVSAFMICVNELTALKTNKKIVLKDLLVILAPFAPFITEELWENLGETGSIHAAQWPAFRNEYIAENTFSYPVSINGRTRTNIELPLDMPNEEIEKAVLALDSVVKWTEGKQPKKVIIVKGKIVNVVV